MMSLYNEYLSGAEREAAIIVAESDAHYAKLNVLFEAVEGTLNANMLAAEAKVFAEGGTYDDLEMLYREAAEEAAQKKQGILASIVNAIENLFSKIAGFISSKFGKSAERVNELPEESVKLDKSFLEKVNIFKKLWDVLKGSVNKIKAGNYESIGDIASAWGPLVTSFGAITAGGTIIVVKRSQIVEWVKTINGEILKNVNDAIKKLKMTVAIAGFAKDVSNANMNDTGEKVYENKEKSAISKITDKALDILKKILEALKWLGGKISGFLGSLYSAIPFPKEEIKDEAKAAKDETPVEESAKVHPSSIFGYDMEAEETFYESEMTEQELADLDSVFEDL